MNNCVKEQAAKQQKGKGTGKRRNRVCQASSSYASRKDDEKDNAWMDPSPDPRQNIPQKNYLTHRTLVIYWILHIFENLLCQANPEMLEIRSNTFRLIKTVIDRY